MVAADCKCGGYFPQSIQSPWTRDFEQVDRIHTYGAFCLHSDIHDSIKVCGIKEPHIKIGDITDKKDITTTYQIPNDETYQPLVDQIK